MVAMSNLPAPVATSCVTFERRSFSGKVTKLTLTVGFSFSNTCLVSCSICTICPLLTVATVSVVVLGDDDWLEGEHAASPEKSSARPVSTAMARSLIFIVHSSMIGRDTQDGTMSDNRRNRIDAGNQPCVSLLGAHLLPLH